MPFDGDAYRAARHAAGLTQHEVRKRVQPVLPAFRDDYLGRYENGHAQPSLETYMALVDALEPTSMPYYTPDEPKVPAADAL